AAVYYKYKDTLVAQMQPIKENKRYLFIKPELPDSLIKSISGYVRVKAKSEWLGFSDIMLYNISYSDSLSINNLEAERLKAAKNDLPSDKDVNDVERPRVKRSKIPVLSNEKVNSNPLLRENKSDKAPDVEVVD
ncbi:MAG: DUF4296 domain-containing protein, partial [Prevotella sp.]|nr:DUF4296 domain-containing protein [Prevotella sp.]